MSDMKILKPIAFFDVETTGTDVNEDRIIELSIIHIDTVLDYKVTTHTFRFKSLIPISPGAQAVHGISMEDLADKPYFKDVANIIFEEHFKGCDLGGYNALKFDIPILSEEFSRSGIDFPAQDVKVYDPMVIFHKMNPRDLKSAVKHYLKVDLQDAHSAEADILATVSVFKEQMSVHFENKPDCFDKAAEFCNDKSRVDFAGRLILNDQGVMCYNFGMHKNTPVKKDAKTIQYGHWMLSQSWITSNTARLLRAEMGLKPIQAYAQVEVTEEISDDDELPI